MKPKSNPFLRNLSAAAAFCLIATYAHAADVTLTGSSAINGMNTNYTVNSQDALILDITGVGGNRASDSMGAAIAKSGGDLTIDGSGTLRVTGGSGDVLGVADVSGRTVNIALGSGGLIDIQGGAFVNGGWGGGNWSANLADMNIASGAVFDAWDGGAIRVDALTGAGSVQNGTNSPGFRSLVVGVNGGSGTFSGVIGGGTGRAGNNAISLTKEGSGTQILGGSNTYNSTTAVNGGTLQIGDGSTTGSLGTGNVTIASGAVLEINRSDAYGTTGGQTFGGAGTLVKNGSGSLTFYGTGPNQGLVSGLQNLVINDGTVRTDSWAQWKSDLNLTVNGSGKFEMWNTTTSIGNLSGNGTVQNTANWSGYAGGAGHATNNLTIAAGNFSGTIADNGIGNGGNTGTDGDTRINLIKSSAGTLSLTGATSYTGSTTVAEGTLSLGNGTSSTNLADTATVSIAYGAMVALNFSGSDTIGKLIIDGNTMSGGTYNATTHPDYFTGSGSLVVLNQDGNWTSTADGNWGTSSNWQSDVIATGTNKTAFFSATSIDPITVTLDSSRDIGSLSFLNADYTIAGSNVLTLDSASGSIIDVEAGRTATINSALAGTPGVEKTGDGSLILSGANSYTGATSLTAGVLELQAAAISNFRSSTTIASGATLKVTGDATGYLGSDYNGLALGSAASGFASITGSGTLVIGNYVGIRNGSGAASIDVAMGSGGLIDIQSGALVNGGWGGGNWFSNLADMNIASGAALDLWDGNAVTIDALTGSGSVINGSNNPGMRSLIIGADNGSGTFSGVIGGGARLGADIISLTKTGSGTQTLSGANTYIGNTTVDGGSLIFTATSQMQFVVTDAPASNMVTGAGTATFNGTFNINTAAVSGTTAHTWLLVDRSSLSGESFGSTFSVTGFADPEDDGIWTMSDAKGNWSFDEATGELTFATGNDYENWKSANAVVGGPNDDDDHDGLNNFNEYAFGLNPHQAESVNPIVSPYDKVNGTFSYTRRYGSNQTAYTVEISEDLVSWVTASASEGAASVSNGVETVEITLNPVPSSSKLFIRVKAEQTPH